MPHIQKYTGKSNNILVQIIFRADRPGHLYALPFDYLTRLAFPRHIKPAFCFFPDVLRSERKRAERREMFEYSPRMDWDELDRNGVLYDTGGGWLDRHRSKYWTD